MLQWGKAIRNGLFASIFVATNLFSAPAFAVVSYTFLTDREFHVHGFWGSGPPPSWRNPPETLLAANRTARQRSPLNRCEQWRRAVETRTSRTCALYTQVDVMVASRDALSTRELDLVTRYHPWNRSFMHRSFSESIDELFNSTERGRFFGFQAESVADMEAYFSWLHGQCLLIRNFIFSSHGIEGQVEFRLPNVEQVPLRELIELSQLDCVSAPGAHWQFDACNLASSATPAAAQRLVAFKNYLLDFDRHPSWSVETRGYRRPRGTLLHILLNPTDAFVAYDEPPRAQLDFFLDVHDRDGFRFMLTMGNHNDRSLLFTVSH